MTTALTTTNNDGATLLAIIQQAAQQPDLDIAKMQQLMELKREWDRDRAAETYSAAITEFQRKCPQIHKGRKPVSGPSYTYASYDDVMAVVSPILAECGIAVTNTYYLARLMRSTNPADKAVAERVGVVFPNQQSWGTHVNVAGGAVARYSKNQTNAVKFLEYLVSPEAQNHFANGNNEWPVVKGMKLDNPALKAMTGGNFKSELVPISAVGMNQIKVQQMLDRVGFK